MATKIALNVNGKLYTVEVEPHESLAFVLREKLRFTDVKVGCGNGECGSCTVLLNGKAVTSCIVPASRCDGVSVQTASGLAENGKLHPLQEKFIEHDAIQCGY